MKKVFITIVLLAITSSMAIYSQDNKYVYSQGGNTNQCEIITDKYGQIATKCIVFRANNSTLERTILGSHFFNNTIWQEGSVDLDGNGKVLPCRISYNLSPVEILCYVAEADKQLPVTPYAFTVSGKQFISYSANAFGKAYRKYFEVVYRGKTKLLKYYAIKPDNPPFELKQHYDSWHRLIETYYIQNGDEAPIEIQLTQRSLQKALSSQTDTLQSRLPRKKLTTDDIITTLKKHDGLIN